MSANCVLQWITLTPQVQQGPREVFVMKCERQLHIIMNDNKSVRARWWMIISRSCGGPASNIRLRVYKR